MPHDNIFDRLSDKRARSGPPAVLEELANYLLAEQRYHELFETRKMQARQQLGLPLVAVGDEDALPEEAQHALETSLIDACREVGLLLIQAGRLRDAWHYLRAVGDRSLVRQELDRLQPTEENMDEFIELCVHEGMDLRRGFEVMLSHYGTCNSITTFDSVMYGRPRRERAIGASLMVRHLYDELQSNVQGHIERHEGKPPSAGSLTEQLANRPWLFDEGAYHVDTSHLASVVRFAHDADDSVVLGLATELAEYGQHLDSHLQYPGDEPFEDLYPASLQYFSALRGDDTDAHLEYFRQRAEAVNLKDDRLLCIETYIDLLARLGRHRQALTDSLRLLPEGVQLSGRAPSLYELAEAAGNFSALEDLARQRGDAVGFAVSLIRKTSEPR